MGFGDIFKSVGGSILGSIGGAATSGLFSAREADENRSFQAKMSNTAHQREVKDLKAAGLNPVLSAGGQGASAPSGSMASISVPDIAGAINSARQTTQQGRLIDAQIKSLLAGAAKTTQEARTAAVTAGLDESGAKAIEKFGPGAKLLMQLGSMFSSKK